MPVYHSVKTFYGCLKAMFDRIESKAPAAMKGLAAAHLSLRIMCALPEAEVTLDGHQRPVHTTYGPAPARADLDVIMSADTLHAILMDELSMKKAMGSGLVQVHGPAWKLKVLIDIVKAGRLFYPALARQHKLV